MKNYITYKISITCEVNKHGAVIPVGSQSGIEEDKNLNKKLNMLEYPNDTTIMQIWIGKCLQYPLIKKL